MNLKVLIVDDEPRSRRVLESYLNEYCTGVEVLEAVGSVAEAVEAINNLKPDLVFLDIEMPGENGFALLNYFSNPDFMLIFITAYQEYAIKAFRSSAIDYLLKPLEISELTEAVDKATKLHSLQKHQSKLNTLRTNLNGDGITHRLALPVSDGYVFINVEEIVCLEANGSYTQIHFSDKKPMLVSKKMYKLEEMIAHPNLFKPHRSFLVNLGHVEQYIRRDGGYIIMSNEMEVPLTQNRKNQFMEAVKNKI